MIFLKIHFSFFFLSTSFQISPCSVQHRPHPRPHQRLQSVPHCPQRLGSLQGPAAQAAPRQSGWLHGRGRRPAHPPQQQLHLLHHGHHRPPRRVQAERLGFPCLRGRRQGQGARAQEDSHGQLHKLLQRCGRERRPRRRPRRRWSDPWGGRGGPGKQQQLAGGGPGRGG